MWAGSFLVRAVTYTSSLPRGVSMKPFGDIQCKLIATVGRGMGEVGADSYLRLEVLPKTC